MIVKMIQGLGKRMEAQMIEKRQEMYDKPRRTKKQRRTVQ